MTLTHQNLPHPQRGDGERGLQVCVQSLLSFVSAQKSTELPGRLEICCVIILSHLAFTQFVLFLIFAYFFNIYSKLARFWLLIYKGTVLKFKKLQNRTKKKFSSFNQMFIRKITSITYLSKVNLKP